MSQEESMSIAEPHPAGVDVVQKIGLALASIGVLILFVAWGGYSFEQNNLFLAISLSSILSGAVVFGARTYLTQTEGIKNNKLWQNALTNRGVWGWIVGIILTGFYILLYWYPQHLGLGQNGEANRGLVHLFDPLSQFFKGQPASQWFVYGTIYTLLIVSLGVKFMFKYRGNRYQLIRTSVVIVSQLFLAYLIPEILEGFSDPDHYFAKDIKNVWPLNYYFFNEWHLDNMLVHGGSMGMFYFVTGLFMFLLFTPIITYYVGKRWYCSWVCGCGGLAETAGDSFRHLSSKKVSVWKLERWMIHTVMVLIFITTAVTLYGYFTGTGDFLGMSIYTYFQQPYGFLIGATFSGVVGVGFYPLLGNRVWCRFGCPMAAYMGIIQRFKSKFRITTNGAQCISCGNCSTYCEQGIDVRWYAQRGQNIVRASCVGCGICSAVCPRGVLKLENGPEAGRINDNPILIGDNNVGLNENM
ncbi:MAG: 4Fe-4S binding protein [Flavobacteriales bacterium]|nr:4Fe-4S binding protein [Flavobacteriales bacterium]